MQAYSLRRWQSNSFVMSRSFQPTQAYSLRRINQCMMLQCCIFQSTQAYSLRHQTSKLICTIKSISTHASMQLATAAKQTHVNVLVISIHASMQLATIALFLSEDDFIKFQSTQACSLRLQKSNIMLTRCIFKKNLSSDQQKSCPFTILFYYNLNNFTKSPVRTSQGFHVHFRFAPHPQKLSKF